MCKLGVILRDLVASSGEDAAALQGALDDPLLTGADIYRVLAANGFRVGVTTVKAHRREDCACVFGD